MGTELVYLEIILIFSKSTKEHERERKTVRENCNKRILL